MSIDCWKCLEIIALFKIHRDNNDRERLQDTRDWARQHVSFHNAGLAHGQLTPGVQQIANEKDNGGK